MKEASPRPSGVMARMGRKVRTARGDSVDEAIALIASGAHGVVTRRELLDSGVTSKRIRRRVEHGSLIPVHRGVYRVGHLAPSLEARYFAAVKACGPGALLAGRAAAHLWGLIKGSPPKAEVLAPNDRRVRGVVVHRARGTDLAETGRRRGIPITNVPRTLVDLASSLPEDGLARACHEAGVRYKTTPRQVEAVLIRLPNAPGRAKLMRVLHGDVRVTLSRLESRFLNRLRKADLPLPVTNRVADGRRVDCRWPERRLTVELDSYRFHNSRHSWEQDRQREREARARGDEFRRYTWADVVEEPRLMLTELRGLLGRPELGPV
jgi:Transcriptional regulator, AbiEi antitoxin